jgi:predicted Rossmann fold nucleotide-binding protein DprA/Smf involved in DNA uptake
MKNMNYYDIYLSRIDISNENKLKLLKKFGSAELILKQSKSELLNEGFEEKTVDKILNSDFKNMKKYIDYMNKNDIKIIACTQNN